MAHKTYPRSIQLGDLFEVIADAIPNEPALITNDVKFTYAELDERITRLANHLLSIGIKRGEHVGGSGLREWAGQCHQGVGAGGESEGLDQGRHLGGGLVHPLERLADPSLAHHGAARLDVVGGHGSAAADAGAQEEVQPSHVLADVDEEQHGLRREPRLLELRVHGRAHERGAPLGRHARAALRIGVGAGRLHPLAVARTVAIAKASAWVGAVMLGWWTGVLAHVLPRRSELRMAAADAPGAGVAALSALALVIAALWLQHCCKSPGETTGIEDTVGD